MSGLVNGLQNRLRRFESARHLFLFNYSPHFFLFLPQHSHTAVAGVVVRMLRVVGSGKHQVYNPIGLFV